MTTLRPFRIHHKGITYKGNRRVHISPNFGLFRWYQVVDPVADHLYSADTIDLLRDAIENDITTVKYDWDSKKSYSTQSYHAD